MSDQPKAQYTSERRILKPITVKVPDAHMPDIWWDNEGPKWRDERRATKHVYPIDATLKEGR